MKIETKYNIGNKVFTIHNNSVFNFSIDEIDVRASGDSVVINYVRHYTNHISKTEATWESDIFKESCVFKTKQELIDSL